jgi:hypothetical protein
MATRIVFAAARGDGSLSIDVEQTGVEIHSKWNEAGGQVFELTEALNSERVWVNPATIAYWEEAASGSASF